MSIMYNWAREETEYKTDVIPATAYLYFIYSIVEDVYGFCVFSDQMKSDLENAVIYTDDRVIDNAIIGSSHDPQDMWSVALDCDDVAYLFSLDHFTVKLTINGKKEMIDISRDKTPYVYEMVYQLVGVQLYSDTTYENYRSSAYLPGGVSVTAIPESNTEDAYSFREDYEKVDLAAKSVFYVEICDKQFNVLGSASGFVSFDEHLFITNQHVIQDASYLKVWDDNDKMCIIDKVAMSDKEHDLAILLFPDGKNYNALEQGGEDELKRGQPVVTIGSPIGFQNTVAYGNISAFPVMEGIKYIQFTAPISHGSSGGCLFNDNGKVIGVTSAGNDEGQNLNFAIPIKQVQDLYNQWDKISYETLGTKRSWDMVGVPACAESIAVGQFINEYGVINHYVNFRSRPSVDSRTAGDPLRSGVYVYLIVNEMNSKGEVWTKVNVNGKEGYIKSEYIDILSKSDSDAYNQKQATPAPVYTATPAPTMEPENAETIPENVLINQYGVINHYVNFRSGPSVDSELAGEPVQSGKYVYLIVNEKNSKGEIWTRVNIDGKEGYIKSEYIYVIGKNESDIYDKSQSTPAPVYTAAPIPVSE